MPYGATPGGGGSEGGAGPDLYLSLQQLTHHLTTAQHNHNLRAMQHAQAQLRATTATTATPVTPDAGPFAHPLAVQPHLSQDQHQDQQQLLHLLEQQHGQGQGPHVSEAFRALSLARECTLDPKAGLPCDPAAAGGGLPCMDPATGLPRVSPVATTPCRGGGSGHTSARVSLAGNLPLLGEGVGEGEGPEGAGAGARAEAAVAAAAVEFAGWSIAGAGERAESVQLMVRGRRSGQGQGQG